MILLRGDQAGAASGNQKGEKKTKGKDDPVYGSALAETWTWLDRCRYEDGEVDFGIACLAPRLPDADSLAALNAPAPDAPVMLPSHIDCWAQTAPLPRPSPDVAAFLHGPREGAADVRICWRGDLNLTNEEARAYALESLTLCPPSSSETLPVPFAVKVLRVRDECSRGDEESHRRNRAFAAAGDGVVLRAAPECGPVSTTLRTGAYQAIAAVAGSCSIRP